MSQDHHADQTPPLPKWIPAGSAVLGAFFAYFSLVVGFVPIALLYQLGDIRSTNYGTLVLPVAIAVIAGAGLRFVARRYRSPSVQAGALVGAGIMTLLLVFGIGLDARVGIGPTVLLVLVGIGVFIIVFPLTANPSSEHKEQTGVDLLQESFDAWRRSLFEPDQNHSKQAGESTPEPAVSSPERPSGFGVRLPVSGYWLVVGSAFIVATPIALVNTELGLGLLSSFLTAYAISLKIES